METVSSQNTVGKTELVNELKWSGVQSPPDGVWEWSFLTCYNCLN